MRISVTQPGAGRPVWSGDPLCQGGDEAWKTDHSRLSTSQRQEKAGSWSAWEPCKFFDSLGRTLDGERQPLNFWFH